MCCPRPSELGIELLMVVTHTLWVGGLFSFGHLLSMAAFNCREGWSNCTFVEPFGITLYLIGSILYFFILKHVANFLYKRELPGGEELTSEMKQSLNNLLSGQNIRKTNKKGKN